ncbi:peptidase inhibitor family I36 protein [Streptomyces sp. NPDC002156]
MSATIMLPAPVSAQPDTERTAAVANGASYARTDKDITDAVVSVMYMEASGLAACRAGWACLWQYRNFNPNGGTMVAWPAGSYSSDFRNIPCPGCSEGDFHDDASSWANKTDRNYCVSWGTNGGNPDNTMPVGTSGNFTPEWDNQASSIGFIGCP